MNQMFHPLAICAHAEPFPNVLILKVRQRAEGGQSQTNSGKPYLNPTASGIGPWANGNRWLDGCDFNNIEQEQAEKTESQILSLFPPCPPVELGGLVRPGSRFEQGAQTFLNRSKLRKQSLRFFLCYLRYLLLNLAVWFAPATVSNRGHRCF
jgi:hypothetical protein